MSHKEYSFKNLVMKTKQFNIYKVSIINFHYKSSGFTIFCLVSSIHFPPLSVFHSMFTLV